MKAIHAQRGEEKKKVTHQDHIYLKKADTPMCAYDLQEPREALGMKKKVYFRSWMFRTLKNMS